MLTDNAPAACQRLRQVFQDMTREDCKYCDLHQSRAIKYCPLASDYRDCAEFEARVAAKILDVTIGDLPCAEGPDCQAPHFYKYNTKEKAVGCNMCTLCVARLAVEVELEAKR